MNGQGTRFLDLKIGLLAAFLLFPFLGQAQTTYVDTDFNSNIPASWTVNDGGSNPETWKQVTSYGYSDDDLDGTPFAIVSSDDAGYGETLDEELVTPSIDASGQTYAYLEFDQYYNDDTYDDDTSWVDVYDGTSWVTVLEQADSDVGDWDSPDHQRIDISGMTNANMQVRFRYSDNGDDADEWAIDNVRIQGSNCQEPSGLTATILNSDSIEVSWTSNGSGSEWEIAYGPAGTSPSDVSSMITTENPDTITGVSSTNTVSYDIYVRENCGSGDSSLWIGPVNKKVSCPTVFNAPFYEDFNDSELWNLSSEGISPCWGRNPDNTSDYHWGSVSGETGSSDTGPSGDFPTGNGNYVHTDATDGSEGDVAELMTPWIDATSLNSVHLRYFNHFYGEDIDTFSVAVDSGSGWTPIDTIVGEQHSSLTDAWHRQDHYLQAYGNDTVRFRFTGIEGPDYKSDYSIDSVSVTEVPSCIPVQDLQASTQGADAVELSWTSSGSEWEVEYGPKGFAQGNGDDTLTLNSNPATVSGLSSNTEYDFYVRNVCGAGDTSSWTYNPASALTECDVFATPFHEDFDSAPFKSGGGDTGEISNCWTRVPQEDGVYSWRPDDGGTGSSGTGPSDDHPGGGNYMFTEGSDASGTDQAILTTPRIDLSSLTLPRFKFYYHFYGVEMDSFIVSMDKGSGWTGLDTITGQTQTSATDPWKRYDNFLQNSTNDTARFRFKAVGGNHESDYAIDSVVVEEAPSCPFPTNFTARALNWENVELSWNSSGPSNEWQVEYGPTGFTQGNGTDTITLSSNPDTITGLSENTAYDFYVREVCGPSDTSAWVGPDSAQTNCLPATAAYFEDFNSAPFNSGGGDTGTIDPCWSRTPAANNEFSWRPDDGGTGTGGTGPADDMPGGGNYMYTEGSDGSQGEVAKLTSDWIDMSSLTTPQFSFYYHFHGSEIDRFFVSIDTGNGWYTVDTIVGEQQTSETSAWKRYNNYLFGQGNDTARFKLEALRGGGNESDYAIDSFMVKNAPACPTPTNFTANAINSDSVELDWTSNATGTEWTIIYGPAGFTPGMGGDTTSTTSIGDTILTDPTTSYDFYIKEVCSASDTSSLVGPTNLRTPCAPSYTTLYKSGFDKTSTDTPLCWTSLYNTGSINVVQVSDKGYQPRSNPQMLEFDYPNGTEDTIISITPQFTDLPDGDNRIHFYGKGEEGAYGELLVVGTMTDPTDFNTWTPLDTINAGGTWEQQNGWTSNTIRLENTSKIGSNEYVGLRHLDSAGAWELYIDDFRYEEIPDNDVGVQAILGPQGISCPSDSVEVEVVLRNFSNQAQSNFDFTYTINGASPVTETYSQSLQPGKKDTVKFAPTSSFTTPGNYTIASFTELSGDTALYNDTMKVDYTVPNGSMAPTKNDTVNTGGYGEIVDSLYICGSSKEFNCARILTLTIDSMTHGAGHEWTQLELISPEGTVLNLWDEISDADAFDNITFTDTASQNASSISVTSGAVSGAYSPEEQAGFDKFNGEQLNGLWRLRINNTYCCDDIDFYGWNMRAVDPNKPQPDLGQDTAICQEKNLLLDPGQDPDWSYRWDNNSTESTRPVVGSFLDTNNSYSYHVTVTDERPLNMCSNSDTIEVTVENCTGMEDRKGGGDISFKVHPNPAKDRLNIRSEGADGESFRYELMDLQGRTLETLNGQGAPRSTMNVSELSKGVYILKGYREADERPLFQQKVVIR